MEYEGLYTGFVVDNEDPKKIGRCRVRVPSIHGTLKEEEYGLLPWARGICSNPTGKGRTTFILPKVGDLVYVSFLGGDVNYPVYLGSSYAVGEPPLEDTDDYFTTDVIYSDGEGTVIKRTEKGLDLSYGKSGLLLQKNGQIVVRGSLITEGSGVDATRTVSATEVLLLDKAGNFPDCNCVEDALATLADEVDDLSSERITKAMIDKLDSIQVV